MKNSARVMVSTFGLLVGLAGIEHGVGEMLQGNTTPKGFVFPSWPNAAFFRIFNGEPAASIVPNLLVTGILATLVSLVFITWAVRFNQRKYGGLVLISLSMVLFLVGGGIFPPVFGLIIGAAVTRLNAPAAGRRDRLPKDLRNVLGRLWPWSFGAAVLAWLSMVPGLAAMDYFFGYENTNLIWFLLASMFGFLILSMVTSLARDSLG